MNTKSIKLYEACHTKEQITLILCWDISHTDP